MGGELGVTDADKPLAFAFDFFIGQHREVNANLLLKVDAAGLITMAACNHVEDFPDGGNGLHAVDFLSFGHDAVSFFL